MTRIALALLLLASVAPADDDPLAEARNHYWHRDHRLAEAALLERLATHRDDVEARSLLAEVYLRMERPDDAILAATPGLPDPLCRANVWEAELSKAGWSDEARAALRAKLEAFDAKTPDDLRALYLGWILLDDKAGRAALRQRILAEMPDDPPEEVEGDLLEAVIVTKEPEPRIALIRQFLSLFPESKQSNYLREILLWCVREDRERLFAEATAMLRADPDNRRVRAALARWLMDTDPPDPSRALHQIRRAIDLIDTPREIDRPELLKDDEWERALAETRAKYLVLKGRAELLLGRTAAAIETLSRAEETLEYDVDLYLALAEAYASRLDERGLEALWRAVASGPSPKAERALRDVGGNLGQRWFKEVTESAGLAAARGSRIAASDVNGDGWPDLLFGGSRLFLNDGDGTFTAAPMPGVKGARGGLFADLDNDGDVDLLVFRTEHPLVLENDGKGAFTDRTCAAMKDDAKWYSEAAAVLDVDGDGRLDLYLANYERRPNPPWARGTPDRLFRNEGDFAFADATDRIKGTSAEPMCGRGAAPGDFDGDGDTDLFVANYRLDPDYLFVNDGKGDLVNEARARGVEGECDEGAFGHGIGPAWGDLNGDGNLDLVVGNLAHPRYIGFSDKTRVFVSSGPPDFTFADTFEESGIRYEETHSNPSLADVDLDGDLDLFLTSVYVGRWSYLYENHGHGVFTDVTWRAGVRIDNGWGSIFVDYDLDGDPDLVVRTSKGMKLFRNDHPGAGAFLGLTLVGRTGNGSAIGARVTVHRGGREDLVREVGGGTGTGCQDDPSLRFGLGEDPGPLTIEVRWPGGRVQRILGVDAGAVYRLVEGGNLEMLAGPKER